MGMRKCSLGIIHENAVVVEDFSGEYGDYEASVTVAHSISAWILVLDPNLEGYKFQLGHAGKVLEVGDCSQLCILEDRTRGELDVVGNRAVGRAEVALSNSADLLHAFTATLDLGFGEVAHLGDVTTAVLGCLECRLVSGEVELAALSKFGAILGSSTVADELNESFSAALFSILVEEGSKDSKDVVDPLCHDCILFLDHALLFNVVLVYRDLGGSILHWWY